MHFTNPTTPVASNFNPSLLEQGERIGSGAFGVVFLGRYRYEPVAIKALSNFQEKSIEAFEREYRLMEQVNHGNVVRVKGAIFSQREFSYKIVMEYVSGGTLTDLLRTQESISLSTLHRIAKDIAAGMACLHDHDIVHCDLKPSNILLDGAGVAKITDFGLARLKNQEGYGSWHGGTLLYLAPELVEAEHEGKNSKQGDVFSYGMTVWEMCSRQEPWKEEKLGIVAIAQAIVGGKRPKIKSTYPKELTELIERCWKQDPTERPPMKDTFHYLDTHPLQDNEPSEKEVAEKTPSPSLDPSSEKVRHRVEKELSQRTQSSQTSFAKEQNMRASSAPPESIAKEELCVQKRIDGSKNTFLEPSSNTKNDSKVGNLARRLSKLFVWPEKQSPKKGLSKVSNSPSSNELKKFPLKLQEAIRDLASDSINTLTLDYICIDLEGSTALCNALKFSSSLRELDLSYSNISSEGATALFEALKHNTALRHLYLRRNNIGPEGVIALSEALKLNATLENLYFCDNNISSEGAIALSEALKLNASIKHLNLNNIGSEGATALCKVLKFNAFLEILSLDSNNIGSEGATELSKALKLDSNIKSLYLHNNNIGLEGATALCEVLKLNTSLQILYLNNNNIGSEGATALCEALKHNTTLRNLYLKDNNIGSECATALREAMKSNTTLGIYW